MRLDLDGQNLVWVGAPVKKFQNKSGGGVDNNKPRINAEL